MENEPLDNLENDLMSDEDKKEPRKKLLSWIVFFGFVVLLFSSTNNSSNPATTENAKFEHIIEQSTTNFFKEFDSGPIYSNAIVYLDETITPSESVRIYENIELALAYLHEPLSTTTFDLRIFDDYEALKSDMLKFTPVSMQDAVEDDLSKDGIFGSNSNCRIPGSVGVTYDEGWFRPRIFILTECGWMQDAEDNWKLTDPEVIAHEIAHVAQNNWYKSTFYTWSCFVPRWMTEGQAQFISAQLASVGKGFEYKKFRKAWMYWSPNAKLAPDENYDSDYGPYSDGAFAFEYLIGKFGWDYFETLVSKLNISYKDKCGTAEIHERFARAFKEAYGYSLTKFYREVSDYISWNISELDYVLN